MTYASIRRAYAQQLDEQVEAGAIAGKDIPLATIKRRKKVEPKEKIDEDVNGLGVGSAPPIASPLDLAYKLMTAAQHVGLYHVVKIALRFRQHFQFEDEEAKNGHNQKGDWAARQSKAAQYLATALNAVQHKENDRAKSMASAAYQTMFGVTLENYTFRGLQAPVLTEGKGLLGKNLVALLTNICLEEWYSLIRKFSSNPDTYDVHPSEPHPQFETFKMTPGNDKRDDSYSAILSTASALTKGLNGAFGKDVFEQRVSRTGGGLQVLVAFSAGKGGVFQCKAENNGGDSAINLTMPNREELTRAFSAMTDTPHPGDELGQMDGDVPETPVAGDIPAPGEPSVAGSGGDSVPTPDIPQPDPVQPAADAAADYNPSPEEEMAVRRRFESMANFLGKTLNEQKWKVTWMDRNNVAQSHIVTAPTASQATLLTQKERQSEIPQGVSFNTEEIKLNPNAARTPPKSVVGGQ